jgi:hypothetical protein
VVKDDIPDGTEFITYTEGDGSINDKYGWKLLDANGNEITDSSKAKYIVTNYLAKENGEDKLLFTLEGYEKVTSSVIRHAEDIASTTVEIQLTKGL